MAYFVHFPGPNDVWVNLDNVLTIIPQPGDQVRMTMRDSVSFNVAVTPDELKKLLQLASKRA